MYIIYIYIYIYYNVLYLEGEVKAEYNEFNGVQQSLVLDIRFSFVMHLSSRFLLFHKRKNNKLFRLRKHITILKFSNAVRRYGLERKTSAITFLLFWFASIQNTPITILII